MSATELIREKAKDLTETEARFLLRCIESLRGPSPKPTELAELPVEIRDQIIAEQFAKAEALYRDNPDLIMEDKEGPVDYE
jgi:hypothetical protein